MGTMTRRLVAVSLVMAVALMFLVAPTVALGGVLGGSLPWVYYRTEGAAA